jgi:hypothetical protein
MAETTPQATPEAQPQPHPPQQPEVILHEKDAHAAYTNFARVTATAEEVILDFCLNPNPFHQGRQELQVSERLIMNFYTAKRLLSALAMTLQRHEGTFGEVQLDVNRRVRQQQQPATQPGVW